jgi:peptide/nickel transport system substrate-binding protein
MSHPEVLTMTGNSPLKLISRLLCLAVGAGVWAAALPGQAQPRNATVVYAVGKEPSLPVPLLTRNEQANEDVADQLFLHLATFTPGGRVTGDDALVPSLARRWRRIDPLTLVFEIDPRARWHDNAPVTAHDVVFTWQLAGNPAVGTDQSRLEPIASVEAINEHAVRVRFKRPSAEQVYLFGFLMQPLPSHLLERMAPAAIGTSSFVTHPVGNGPFRFERRIPGQLYELRADSTFFLGRPTIARVMFTYVEDATARVNRFLTGESDVLDVIPEPALPGIRALPAARLVDVPSASLVYLLFNTRGRADTARPNPLFSDPRVREALTLAIDRRAITTTTWGGNAAVPEAAQSQLWSWITGGRIDHQPMNVARARTLLAQAGWRDANGDGTLDKDGLPFHFSILYPASSAMRNTVALQVQQMLRAVGVAVELDKVDGAVMGPRVQGGQWDTFIQSVTQDPTPTSLVQSWSCDAAHHSGSTNFARWCDTTFDRMVVAAGGAKNQPAAWNGVLARMASLHPAVFLAAPGKQVAVHRRYDNVIIWPSHPWLSLWQWRVRPEAALPRDR